MKNEYHQITIDGPAGAGKSTIAKQVADKLNFLFVNTGAMFRIYALKLKDVDLNDEIKVKNILNNIVIFFKNERIFCNDEDLTNVINTQDLAKQASNLGIIKIVRDKALLDQRKIASENNVVMEGRDIGSIIIPNATLKIFLTASVNERVKRRMNQLNIPISRINEIKKQIIDRDLQDQQRKIAPLVKAHDAIEINSDKLTIEKVCEKIINLYNQKRTKK